MFHTQAFWLRSLRLNARKPFLLPLLLDSSRTTITTAGRMQAEKRRCTAGALIGELFRLEILGPATASWSSAVATVPKVRTCIVRRSRR